MSFDHVLLAARFPLLNFDEWDVEIRCVHVVGAVLVPERSQSLGAGQRQVIQFKFISLVPVDKFQHFLEHLQKIGELLQTE